jgi:uncharacterized sulfatase
MRSVGFALLLTVVLGSAARAAEKPNILFLYTDDQAPFAVGVAGNDQIHTPHMDQLAEEGAYLPNAFVTTPVCSPSRTALMTGQYASEYGIMDWINPGKEPQLGLDPAATTWAEVLQDHGYRTGLVGKWHLGTQERHHPTNQGFGYFMGHREGGWSTADPKLEVDGEQKQFEGLTTDLLTDHALQFIRRNREEPFALMVSFRAPHSAYLPVADEDMAPYEGMEMEIPDYPGLKVDRVKRRTKEYYASISGVDRNLGRMLDTLDEHGIAENTVVIFTSDHGYNTGHHGVWYKGNAVREVKELPEGTEHVPGRRRPNMWDTSLKVPTMVRWPGEIEPGTVLTETVDNTDWYPTFLAIAGLDVPEGVTVRGDSIVPLLKGQNVPGWDNGLYGEYSMHHGAQVHMRMYRTPEWKLVRDFKDRSRDELYHLAEDPDETENLIDDPGPEARSAIERLDAKIRETMRKINDPILPELRKKKRAQAD